MQFKKMILSLGLALSITAYADFDSGFNAFEKGDYEGAFSEWTTAAKNGDVLAQYSLGTMYYLGQGVPQDYAQAMIWFRKAAEQGEATAQYNLGVMYSQGQGVPQDYAQAMIWYRKAAEQGNANAQYNLGVMYLYGKGTDKDMVLAHLFFNLAAVSGDKNAIQGRSIAAEKLSPAQLREAQSMASNWKIDTPLPTKSTVLIAPKKSSK